MKYTSYDSTKKVRKTWKISPVEKVVTSKKEYNRQEAKAEMKEAIDEELDYLDGWSNPIDWNN